MSFLRLLDFLTQNSENGISQVRTEKRNFQLLTFNSKQKVPQNGSGAERNGLELKSSHQGLAINYDDLEQIRQNLIEAARQINSAGNDKSRKVLVRREKKEVTNPKQKRKILGILPIFKPFFQSSDLISRQKCR